jgi:tetratricopeptide (TPR) repeat protein
VLGLMSKPMVMTLPFMLLLLDWWPLRRWAFAEKMPMFALAMLSGFVTSISAGRLGWSSLTLWQRIANALVSYTRYLELSLWPHDLAILYPFRTAIPLWEVALATLLLCGITAAALWQARCRPYLIMGWLWFAVGLLPASGLVQVGRQGMADRFTYLPQIGLVIAVVWGVADLIGKQRPATAAVLSIAIVAAFATASWLHTSVWRDSVVLFTDTVAVTDDNGGAQHFLAAALDDRGRFNEAFPHHAEAERLEPTNFIAQYSYGVALERRGQTEAAIKHFRQALHYFPNYPDAARHLEESQKLLDQSSASQLEPH